MTIRRRRWERKNPAPPPTPEGYVWITPIGQKTQLVPEKKLSNYSKEEMDKFDSLPASLRRRVANADGRVPEYLDQIPRDEPILKQFGIARAR